MPQGSAETLEMCMRWWTPKTLDYTG